MRAEQEALLAIALGALGASILAFAVTLVNFVTGAP